MNSLKYIRYRNQQEAFTITEVVVSALIFAIATAGILATSTSMRRPAVESSEDVTAAFLSKRILDDLRSELDSVTWNLTQAQGGNFVVGASYNTLAPIIVDGITYRPSYLVIEDTAHGTKARKIDLKISW